MDAAPGSRSNDKLQELNARVAVLSLRRITKGDGMSLARLLSVLLSRLSVGTARRQFVWKHSATIPVRPSLREAIRAHVERPLLNVIVRPDASRVRGFAYAETILPRDVIKPDWVCYCAGVGEDIRLERYLAEDLGARVWAFDPTPRAILYMQTSTYDRERLTFEPFGLWREDATLRFFAPVNPAYVSHSATEHLGGAGHFDAPCKSIASAMKQAGHTRVDLLKMNIEGAEDVVLEAALHAGISPTVVMLTWEGSGAMRKAHGWTKRLRRSGYSLLGHDGWYFTYVREAELV
jgi:FkbM family methyltransferase